jgi:ketosteroid isomerase-like protein
MDREKSIPATVQALVHALNAFDIDAALLMFTSEAAIADPSTGGHFEGHGGIRDYIERYFVGYHTMTQILALDIDAGGLARVRVDFTGDFGHEIGRLDLTFEGDAGGLIERIDADLE